MDVDSMLMLIRKLLGFCSFQYYLSFLETQVYLVAGGGETGDSTEILTEGHKKWKVIGTLPTPMHGVRGVSFDNRILLTGKRKTI